MSVNDEHIGGATVPRPQARHRWAICTDCGHHFPIIFGDETAAQARSRRLLADAEKIELLALMGELSPREREVMLRIARGQMPLVIAAELGVHVKTVSTYRARLMEKLRLESNTAIALAAYKAGLLT